jgi:hypothetical protein
MKIIYKKIKKSSCNKIQKKENIKDHLLKNSLNSIEKIYLILLVSI